MSIIECKLGNEEWSQEIPTAKAAGEYTVSYKVDKGNNYNVVTGSVTVTIGVAPLTISAQPATSVYGEDIVELSYMVTEGTVFGEDN